MILRSYARNIPFWATTSDVRTAYMESTTLFLTGSSVV
jgi:hypothetical protein